MNKHHEPLLQRENNILHGKAISYLLEKAVHDHALSDVQDTNLLEYAEAAELLQWEAPEQYGMKCLLVSSAIYYYLERCDELKTYDETLNNDIEQIANDYVQLLETYIDGVFPFRFMVSCFVDYELREYQQKGS